MEQLIRLGTLAPIREDSSESASWGRFQIMWFNHAMVGYATVESFVAAMRESEGKHLLAFVAFVKASRLEAALRSKDWAVFAKGYNGEEYAKNSYDKKLRDAYAKFSKP